MATVTRTLSPMPAPRSGHWLLATACVLACNWAAAQLAPDATTTQAGPSVRLPKVVTTGQALPTPNDVAGFGTDLSETPVSISVLDRATMERWNASRLADLVALDASITDAYNAPGYWDFVSVRGFTLDNRSNYRREGLPISAETTISLANKQRVEILKGTSGIQAGVSAPGGLVNYVVKRPTQTPLRDLQLGWSSGGTVRASVDLSDRLDSEARWAWRLNAQAARLRPQVRGIEGEQSLLAGALDWRLSRTSLIQVEWERGHHQQASQAAFSVLGHSLPAPPEPRLNLNNQPWSSPSRFDGSTGSIRLEQRWDSGWTSHVQWGRQRLMSDDRLAFPFGCSNEGVYDRYCSDGSFDLYDFRSERESRVTDAASLGLRGRVRTGAITHELSTGLMRSRGRQQFQDQAFNWVGYGHVSGTVLTAADPTLSFASTERDERYTEWHLNDLIRLGESAQLWIGLRHTALDRSSVGTDGSNPLRYRQSLTSPWAALSWRLPGGWLLYGSTGRGAESQAVPNMPTVFSNPGAVLPALASRQWELGVRSRPGSTRWQSTVFRIERPSTNVETCQRLGSTCVGSLDGSVVHQGIEAAWQRTQGAHRLELSGMWLDASRRGSAVDPQQNGRRPVNVPAQVLRAQWVWSPAALAGASLAARASHEGSRWVDLTGSLRLPGWTRVDLHWSQTVRWSGTQAVVSAGIDNLFDRRHWRESPYQFGHIYLYPGAERALRMGLQLSLP